MKNITKTHLAGDSNMNKIELLLSRLESKLTNKANLNLVAELRKCIALENRERELLALRVCTPLFKESKETELYAFKKNMVGNHIPSIFADRNDLEIDDYGMRWWMTDWGFTIDLDRD